jgi:glycerol uptake facilitator-like aquaporin
LVPFALGTTYFFLRLFLWVLGAISRHLAVAYAFFAFYGALLAATVFVVLFPVVVFDPQISDPFERAYMVGSAIPSTAGVCAAVAVTLRRWRDGLA